MAETGLVRVREFLAHGSRPVTMPEFSEFWKACTEAEKEQFKADALRWDGQSQYIPAA